MFEKISKKYWLQNLPMFLVAIIGIAYAIYLGFFAHNANKESLFTRTGTIAKFINAKEIASLHGSAEDLSNPAYVQLKKKLITIRSVNPDIRFIYLNGIKDGQVFFYADSENVDSSEYSPPGQPYDEASDLTKKMFQQKTNGFEVASDRWGIWASALVPIIDAENGKVVAVLGMDIPAKKYLMDILAYCLSALLFTALIILLIISQKRVARHMYLAEESLKANNLEIMNLEKIINEKEQKLAEIKEKLSKG